MRLRIRPAGLSCGGGLPRKAAAVLSWTVRTLTVALPDPYPVLIGPGAIARAGTLARRHLGPGGRAVIITSPAVQRHCLAALARSLRRAGLAAPVLLMPDGEPAKTLATAGRLAEQLARTGAGRDALILALGGGVVGDVAAFVASIYMRGVPVIQIPTTVVAMLDSAIGGKTGVNLRAGKNLAGTLHQPRAVVADLKLLASLPPREYRSGLAEALKCGVIADARLFHLIARRTAQLRRREPATLATVLAGAAAIKARVVAADPREAGPRRILNFGHTLGHALESATGYRVFRHGEAVGWGMIAATRLAAAWGRLSPAAAARIEGATLDLLSPLPPIAAAIPTILRHAQRDKKTRAGRLHFVLPVRIGSVEVAGGVPEALVRGALAQTIALSRQPSRGPARAPARTSHSARPSGRPASGR